MSSCSCSTTGVSNRNSIEEFGKLIELRNIELVEMKKSKYFYISPDGSQFVPLASDNSSRRLEEMKSLSEVLELKRPASASSHASKKYKARFPFKPADNDKKIENPFKSAFFSKTLAVERPLSAGTDIANSLKSDDINEM